MSGIFFLVVVLVWLAVVVLLTRWLMRRIGIKSELARMALALSLFVVLLALPVADEIIGSWQFRTLCRENAVLHIDAEKAKGRIVRELFDPASKPMPGTMIPILHTRKSYRDLTTGEEIASEDRYIAKGGWLVRILGLWEGGHPLLMNSAGCSPPLGGLAVAEIYGFTLKNNLRR